MSRIEKRFLRAGDWILIHSRMGNKVAERIARAEWQDLYNQLGADRARQLLEVKYS